MACARMAPRNSNVTEDTHVPYNRGDQRLLHCAGLAVILLFCLFESRENADAAVLQQDSVAAPGSGQATGSISGRITVGGKPASGAIVILRQDPSGIKETIDLLLQNGSSQRTTTGSDGAYQFLDTAPGKYFIEALLPALISACSSDCMQLGVSCRAC